MLTELCAELKNYFLRDREADIHYGEYTISGGSIDLPFLIAGQYFRIVGSVLNDGVYQYPTDGLADEVFTGAVWAMAVPPAVIALAADIEAWRNKYESVDSMAMSPFTSETMPNVYSYTKESTNSANGGLSGWQKQFSSRLAKYRRLSVL
jgi:hypothetical protein